MYAKRRPIKSVYGKAKASQQADLLWQEAMSASPIMKQIRSPIAAHDADQSTSVSSECTVSIGLEDVSQRSRKQAREVLQPTDANILSPRRSSPWKGPILRDTEQTKTRKRKPKIALYCAPTTMPVLSQDENSLLEPPSSPDLSNDLASPRIVASTPLPDRKAPWSLHSTASHIRFDSGDRSLDSISDVSPISSRVSSVLSEVESEDSEIEDLVQEFQDLGNSVSNESHNHSDSTIAKEEDLHDIQSLLSLCKQDAPQDFEAFVKDLQKHSDICKLGEASFSEVYLVTSRETNVQTVYKVIPFGDKVDEVPINDVVQEVRILVAMSGISGFVKTQGTTIVNGIYPADLLQVWDLWNVEHESESTRPDWHESDQRYCIITLENGGLDLEHYKVSSWAQARQIFDKILNTLALGEAERQFEHRDLHWGNVLIDHEADFGQMRVTIIDYTLSRALVADQLSDIAFYGFQDRAIFESDGDDYQFEIYRLMRDSITNGSDDQSDEDWTQFHPNTNVLWLHYLVDKLLHAKNLKKPAFRTTKRNPVLNQEEIDAWKYLDSTWTLLNPRRRYRDDEAQIDSAVKIFEILQITGD